VIRAVLDTNVFISALIRQHGKPDQIYRQAGSTFQLLSSEYILTELATTLMLKRIQSKYQMETTPERRARFIETIRVMADIVLPGTRLDVARDRKDNPVLACAIDGRADYLVTGDRGLLVLDTYEQVHIVTPRTFLDFLQSQ